MAMLRAFFASAYLKRRAACSMNAFCATSNGAPSTRKMHGLATARTILQSCAARPARRAVTAHKTARAARDRVQGSRRLTSTSNTNAARTTAVQRRQQPSRALLVKCERGQWGIRRGQNSLARHERCGPAIDGEFAVVSCATFCKTRAM